MNNNTALLLKFLKFGAVGVLGVLVDFGVTWLCREQLRLNQYIANSAGFCCAVVSNYTLNRIWTFESHNPNLTTEFGTYSLFALIGLGLNNFIIYVLNERMQMNFYVAKLIATCVVMFWNFWANMTFTFK
jgi:putative flippase GtrA